MTAGFLTSAMEFSDEELESSLLTSGLKKKMSWYKKKLPVVD